MNSIDHRHLKPTKTYNLFIWSCLLIKYYQCWIVFYFKPFYYILISLPAWIFHMPDLRYKLFRLHLYLYLMQDHRIPEQHTSRWTLQPKKHDHRSIFPTKFQQLLITIHLFNHLFLLNTYLYLVYPHLLIVPPALPTQKTAALVTIIILGLYRWFSCTISAQSTDWLLYHLLFCLVRSALHKIVSFQTYHLVTLQAYLC